MYFARKTLLIDFTLNKYFPSLFEDFHLLFLVTPPPGTIKRQWGFDHVMTKKTIKRASADIGLVFVAYNLRRIFNILSSEVLKKYLSVLDFYFCTFQRYLKLIYRIIILKFEICFFEKGELKAA